MFWNDLNASSSKFLVLFGFILAGILFCGNLERSIHINLITNFFILSSKDNR
jgi:hypothetical protein